jgi:hypothetical protein
MPKLTPTDYLTGCFALMKVSEKVNTRGMSEKYTCTDLDAKVALKVSGQGSTYVVRGRGWSYTVVVSRGDISLTDLKGSEAEIDQTLTLARIAA